MHLVLEVLTHSPWVDFHSLSLSHCLKVFCTIVPAQTRSFVLFSQCIA